MNNTEELKPCPFCGGIVRFHSDEDCLGCHYIECSGCKAMFDFSPTTDPENQCDSLHDLQCGITHAWNTRAQLPSQGGEAVEVVGYHNQISKDWSYVGRVGWEPLMTVAQHQSILAEATHPADQVADDLTMVKVSRELLVKLLDEGRRAETWAAQDELRALLNGGR